MSDHESKKDTGCAHCDAIAAGATEEEAVEIVLKQIEDAVKQTGIAICVIPGEEAPTLYHTIGMTDLGFPEVFLFGLNAQLAKQFLNLYHAELLMGSKKPGNGLITDYFNLPVRVLDCERDDQVTELMWKAESYYQRQAEDRFPQYVQWVFSDKNGKFEWEEGFMPHFWTLTIGQVKDLPSQVKGS